MSIPSASIAAAVAGLFQIASAVSRQSNVSSIRTTFGSSCPRHQAPAADRSRKQLERPVVAGTEGVVVGNATDADDRGLDLAREHGAADLDDDGEWVGRRLEGER